MPSLKLPISPSLMEMSLPFVQSSHTQSPTPPHQTSGSSMAASLCDGFVDSPSPDPNSESPSVSSLYNCT